MWDGVRNGTDTHLKRGAVADEFGAVLADGRFDLVGLGELGLNERGVVLDEDVDLRHGDHGLSEGAGNVLVHDGDDAVGALHGGQRSVDRRTERHISVLVGRADLNHGDVAGYGAAAVELLGLAQEDRNVVGITALGYLAHVRTDEEGVELEDALELRIGIGSRTLGVEVVYMDVLQLSGFAALAHGVDQALRSGCYGAQVHVISRLDDLDGLFGRCEFDLRIHWCVFGVWFKNQSVFPFS